MDTSGLLMAQRLMIIMLEPAAATTKSTLTERAPTKALNAPSCARILEPAIAESCRYHCSAHAKEKLAGPERKGKMLRKSTTVTANGAGRNRE